MIVTFISQCEKKALKHTRRVLDAFANRLGDRTWQTVITLEGLNAVKKLLRKTASKNTAVSCHWSRSRSRNELVWIIGNRSKFNQQGIVPVNTTQMAIINNEWENDWHYLPLIRGLCALAALFHDWGKASDCFQKKLKAKNTAKYSGDPIRHEWISVLFLHAFVGNDSDQAWLTRLAQGEFDQNSLIQSVKKEVSTPLKALPPIASLLAWLVVTHHRLPLPKIAKHCDDWQDEPGSLNEILGSISKQWGYENQSDDAKYQQRLKACFSYRAGLPHQSNAWLKQVKKWASKLLKQAGCFEKVMKGASWRLVLHHARLALMLGDHYYSSQQADKNWHSAYALIANTDRETGQAKQQLDEHLVGVAKHAVKVAHLLPRFETEPPVANDIKRIKQKSQDPRFKWQDTAVNKIKRWRQAESACQNQKNYGFFAVNMASTGCGKTIANAKVMAALSAQGDSLRYVLALGLRSLTLQTGDEYRERIGLDNSELAVVIGSTAVLELHQKNQQALAKPKQSPYEKAGSESSEPLLDEALDYDCTIPEADFVTVLPNERSRQFLFAPVLACTIDHLMAATETKRGGRYILPSLRLMSSDLVIDEVDDFCDSDLVAIGRLIHLAGMLGRKVMLSSATIPPDLAQGYFNAYQAGWSVYGSDP